MAMAMAWACKELAALSRFLGDNAYALQLLEQRAALVETSTTRLGRRMVICVRSAIWPRRLEIQSDGRQYQPAGLVDPGRRRTEDRLDAVLTAIDKWTKNTASSSVSPPTRAHDSHVGRMSGMLGAV